MTINRIDYGRIKLSDEQIKILSEIKRREYKANPFLLIRESKLKIKVKSGQYIPFLLNSIQKKLLDKIEKLWFEKKPIRLWILKARQQGVSTLLEAVIYVLTALRENINSMIISDDIDGSNYLFDMSKRYHEEAKALDYFLVPEPKRSNAKELVFEATRSQIMVDTAKNILAGRKYTFQLCHLSEIAFYDHPDVLLDGLNQAVPELAYTMMVGETTANGVGGTFWQEWKKAENRETAWIPMFFGWYENSEYTRDFENEQEEINLRETLGKDTSFNDHVGEENQLVEQYKCTLEQLNWRRFTIRNKCRGSLDTFHQEYPAYPEQSFLVSGRTRFDREQLRIIYDYAMSQKPQIGYLAYPTEYQLQTMPELQKNPNIVIFNQDQSGDWSIWEMPDSREEYVIFCDPAGGEEVEGAPEGEKGDYNTIEIFRRGKDQLVQAAEYRSRIDPDILADEAFLGWEAYYEPFTLGVEVNSIGRSTADHLKHRAPVYHREILDEVSKKVTKKLGWYTDIASRKTMIDEMAAGIRDGWLVIRSTVLAGEAMTFIRDSKGKYQAQQGCFDDTVMCTAGAIQMHLRTRRKKDGLQQIDMKNTSFRQPGKIESQFIQMKSKLKNRSKI